MNSQVQYDKYHQTGLLTFVLLYTVPDKIAVDDRRPAGTKQHDTVLIVRTERADALV